GKAGSDGPVAFDPRCMHEFVLSGAPARRELQIKTVDIAKRLLDFGMHPPTVYFPLVVDEALMVEPTETETRETLDGFAEAIAEIPPAAGEGPGGGGGGRPETPQQLSAPPPVPPPRRGRGRKAPGHPPAAVALPRVRRSEKTP